MRNRILAELGEARVENGEMTFGELKDLVPAVRPGKLPNAKKLADEEILIERHTEDSDLIIYKSGHVVYTRTDSFGKPHMTVNAVNRCCRMVYQVNFSKQERDEEDYETRTFDCLADEIQYRRIDGKAVKINVINDSHYVNLPWWLPITMICDERIRRSEDKKRDFMSEFSIDGLCENEEGEDSSDNWVHELICNDTCESWIEAEDEKARKAENHRKLMEALKSLTDIQRRTVDLYYSNPGITERDIAQELHINQSTVHRNLQAALNNLRKFF